MKKRSTKPAPFWMSWGSAGSTKKSLSVDVLDRPGVFETIRVYAGRAAGLREHVQRLRESAHTTGVAAASEKILMTRTVEAVRRSGFREAIARLSVHASGLSASVTGCLVRPFAGYPAEWYERGIQIQTASVQRPGPRSWASQVKGNDYLNANAAMLNGSQNSFPLLLTEFGTASETVVANLLILRDGVVWTPPAACGILLGVTRRWAMDAARDRGLKVIEMPFGRHEIFNAEEVWVTNAAAEVLPVVIADGRRIGGGRPGPWAARLRAAVHKRGIAE